MEHFSLYDPECRSGEYVPHVLAYYYKLWKGFDMPVHAHDRVEIMYVLAGSCKVEVEEVPIAMRKGDFILIDAGIPHRLTVEKASPCRMLNLEFAWTADTGDTGLDLKRLAAGSPALARMLERAAPYFVLKDSNDMYLTLKSLILELDDRERSNLLMCRLLLSRVLLQIARLAAENDARNPVPPHPLVKKTLDYLHQRYDSRLLVGDIAAAAGVHPGYLHRIFKSAMGCTVMAYLTNYRMEKAKMLLANTDIPVIEISEYVGINGRQYFSACFKKATGSTPVEYRRSRQMKNA